MKIYTRKGDQGTTGVFGGKRTFKNAPRMECLGTLDEVNATIGLLRSKLGNDHEWQSNQMGLNFVNNGWTKWKPILAVLLIIFYYPVAMKYPRFATFVEPK